MKSMSATTSSAIPSGPARFCKLLPTMHDLVDYGRAVDRDRLRATTTSQPERRQQSQTLNRKEVVS